LLPLSLLVLLQPPSFPCGLWSPTICLSKGHDVQLCAETKGFLGEDAHVIRWSVNYLYQLLGESRYNNYTC
jgi:hypothetical protein